MSRHRLVGFACKGLWLMVVSGLLLLADAGRCWAQGRAAGVYLAEAFTRVTNQANNAKVSEWYGYAEDICILGCWIDKGAKMNFRLNLLGGKHYMFLAGGDNDAEDIGLEILDPSGRVVATDTGASPMAAVPFRTPYAGQYTLRMTLYQSRNNVPCVCVATVLRDGGWSIDVRNLDTAVSRFIRALAIVDEDLQRSNRRLNFRRASNQWCLYGSVLEPGRSQSVTNMDLGFGTRAFAAGGDTHTQDVDLFLLDRNGNTILKDDRIDPTAALFYEANGGAHGLRMLNYQSRTPAVVMMAVFDVHNR